MIIETITVTTTPTSIKDLIETARGGALTGSTTRVDSMLFEVPTDSTGVVKIEQSDGETNTPVTLLDAANTRWAASFPAFKLEEVLLSVASGTQAVGILAPQN